MQLVKNTYFTDDATGTVADRSGLGGIKRKIMEIKLAMELEKNLSKEEILELYINKLNYGANGRGVQNAAEYYFDKDINDLTLSESAVLVGAINSPVYYSPFNYLDHATDRRNNVLYLMYYHGYLSKDEYNIQRAIPIENQLVDPSTSKGEIGDGLPYQAYLDAVIEEAEKLTGKSPYSVPMIIYTAMDRHVQHTIDEIQAGNTGGYFDWPDELMECASVVIDNDTGEMIGVLGGRNYSRGGTLLLNHATQQYKQPGSSIKTLVEYPLAIEYLGYATTKVIVDEPYCYLGTSTIVQNYNGQYYGQVTLEDAIAMSLNAPALKTMQDLVFSEEVGVEGIVEYMNNIGYTDVDSTNFDIQYAIGGSTLEVSVVQQAAAQAAYMNGGVYIQPHTITKIEFLDGTEPLVPEYERKQVISEATAYIMTQILNNNIRQGHSFSYVTIRNNNHPMYGKTGTSNYGSEAAQYGIPVGAGKDSWINSSNADYTVCTWVGYEKAEKDKDTYMSYAKRSFDYQGKVSRLIYEAIEESRGPVQGRITMPSGVSHITHITGIDPYTQPIEGMNEEYIVTGLIKSEFASLVQPEQITIDSLNDFTVDPEFKDGARENGLAIDSDGKGTLKLTWSGYPDPEKLTVVDEEMKLSIYNAPGRETDATGKRLFDWSWVYGPIRYKADVTINGEKVGTVSADNNRYSYKFDVIPGSVVKVCGYYGYESGAIASNKICKELAVEDHQVVISYSNIPFADLNSTSVEQIKSYFNNWANTNGTNVVYKYTGSNNAVDLKYNGNSMNGHADETLLQSELRNRTYEVYIKGYVSSDECTIDPDTGYCKAGDEYCTISGTTSINGRCVFTVTYYHNDKSTIYETRTFNPGQTLTTPSIPDNCTTWRNMDDDSEIGPITVNRNYSFYAADPTE